MSDTKRIYLMRFVKFFCERLPSCVMPRWYHAHAYYDIKKNECVNVIYPLHLAVQLAWLINLKWCHLTKHPSWIDEQVKLRLQSEYDNQRKLINVRMEELRRNTERVERDAVRRLKHLESLNDWQRKMLVDIHLLLTPENIICPKGIEYGFHPPEPEKQLKELCNAIRKIPDKLTAIDDALRGE